jgi:hypothetical protein
MRVPGSHPFATRGTYGDVYPPAFKSMGLPPVTGGRWSVRHLKDGRWRAWTLGRAKRHSRTFYTFETAVHWAHFVSAMYAKKLPHELRDQEIQYRSHELKRSDIIYFVLSRGGIVTASAIDRIIGDSRRGLGLTLARQSSINESLIDQKSRQSLRRQIAR